MKKFVIIILIALIHFALSVLIVPAALSVGSAVSTQQGEPSLTFKTLVVATRILHFPIISQSLYSRHWFPGRWIYIPIFLNSFLWSAGIYLLLYFYNKLIKMKKNAYRKH